MPSLHNIAFEPLHPCVLLQSVKGPATTNGLATMGSRLRVAQNTVVLYQNSVANACWHKSQCPVSLLYVSYNLDFASGSCNTPPINEGAAALPPFAVASEEDTFVDVSLGCSYRPHRKSQRPVCDDLVIVLVVVVVAAAAAAVVVVVVVAVVVAAAAAAAVVVVAVVVAAVIAFAYVMKHYTPCSLAWD